jgi:hypothetical protein
MQELIEASKKELESRSGAYFKTTLDFLKWTTTITIGGMLWMGNNLRSIAGLPLILGVAATLCLFTSLVIGMIVARKVSIAAAKDWSIAIADSAIIQNAIVKHTLLSILPAEELRTRLEQKEGDTSDRKWTALKAAEPFSQPEAFDSLMTGYLIALLVGLFLYISAQVLYVLKM